MSPFRLRMCERWASWVLWMSFEFIPVVYSKTRSVKNRVVSHTKHPIHCQIRHEIVLVTDGEKKLPYKWHKRRTHCGAISKTHSTSYVFLSVCWHTVAQKKGLRLCQMLCFQSNSKKQQLEWSYSPFYSVCVYFLHVCTVRLSDSIPREATWEPLSPLIFKTIQTPHSALSSEREYATMVELQQLNKNFRTNKDSVNYKVQLGSLNDHFW